MRLFLPNKLHAWIAALGLLSVFGVLILANHLYTSDLVKVLRANTAGQAALVAGRVEAALMSAGDPDGTDRAQLGDRVAAIFRNTDRTQSFLVDARGRVLVSSDPSRIAIGRDLSKLPIVETLLARGGDRGESEYPDLTGEPQLGAFHRVGKSDLVVVSQTPKSRAHVTRRHLNHQAAFFIAPMLLALSFGILLKVRTQADMGMATRIAGGFQGWLSDAKSKVVRLTARSRAVPVPPEFNPQTGAGDAIEPTIERDHAPAETVMSAAIVTEMQTAEVPVADESKLPADAQVERETAAVAAVGTEATPVVVIASPEADPEPTRKLEVTVIPMTTSSEMTETDDSLEALAPDHEIAWPTLDEMKATQRRTDLFISRPVPFAIDESPLEAPDSSAPGAVVFIQATEPEPIDAPDVAAPGAMEFQTPAVQATEPEPIDAPDLAAPVAVVLPIAVQAPELSPPEPTPAEPVPLAQPVSTPVVASSDPEEETTLTELVREVDPMALSEIAVPPPFPSPEVRSSSPPPQPRVIAANRANATAASTALPVQRFSETAEGSLRPEPQLDSQPQAQSDPSAPTQAPPANPMIKVIVKREKEADYEIEDVTKIVVPPPASPGDRNAA